MESLGENHQELLKVAELFFLNLRGEGLLKKEVAKIIQKAKRKEGIW